MQLKTQSKNKQVCKKQVTKCWLDFELCIWWLWGQCKFLKQNQFNICFSSKLNNWTKSVLPWGNMFPHSTVRTHFFKVQLNWHVLSWWASGCIQHVSGQRTSSHWTTITGGMLSDTETTSHLHITFKIGCKEFK